MASQQPPLRFLFLGNSQDDDSRGEPFGFAYHRIRDGIASVTGREVVSRRATLFPTASAARYAGRLVDEFDPDIVVLRCTGTVVAALALGPDLARRLPSRLAARVPAARNLVIRSLVGEGSATEVQARPRTWRHRAYRMGRELLFSAGLGQPFISVNEAIQHYGDVIRRITRAENRLLLVSGPDWSPVQHRSVRSVRSESERRLSEFNARLAALCADLRVPHAELLPHFRGAGMRLRHTDGLHLSADGQRIEAELSLRRLTPLLSR